MLQSSIQITIPNSKHLYKFIELNDTSKIKAIEMGMAAIDMIQEKQLRSDNNEFNLKLEEIKKMNDGIISRLNKEIKAKDTENKELKDSFLKKEKELHVSINNSIQLQFEEKIRMKEDEITNLKNENKQTCLELKNISEKHYSEERNRVDKIHKKYQEDISKIRDEYTEKLNEINNRMCKTEENSSIKGKLSENAMLQNLSMLFPKNNIEDTHKEAARGDYIMTNTNDNKFLFENKDYKSNVPKKEIEKFERDMKVNTDICAGIFMSNESGIAKKEDFQIDIVDGKPVCYLHYTNKNIDKIKIAYDIVMAIVNSKIDLSNKEIIDNLNQTSSEIKRKINKCRSQVEKFQKSMLENIVDVDKMIFKVFSNFNIKY